MDTNKIIENSVIEAVSILYGIAINQVDLQPTRKEFEGDVTLVVFPFVKQTRKNPALVAKEIGAFLKENCVIVQNFNVVKGFLNIEIQSNTYNKLFAKNWNNPDFGFIKPTKESKTILVEYCSPNTNKPLHLGHVRNNLLGYSVAEILKASGKKVLKTQIINDRGIHICKSMIAWQKFGNQATPESTGKKGDKLVGDFYVVFDKVYKQEIATLIQKGLSEEEAKKEAPIFKEAQEMLLKWEKGDAETIALWKEMNQWVYDGFTETFKNMGVAFDFVDYESSTYLLGKDCIEKGLEKDVFYKKEDGSVWCDLTNEGLDEKLVLRSDGTSVYITQDIGTAIKRFEENPFESLIYTVGNEQDYHFKVLFLILKKLGYDWAEHLYHLSYGMVDLPSGKMKSREGTVIDADDLMQEMYETAKEIAQESGKLDGLTEEEKEKTYKMVGMGALKYYILKVDPKKRILFNPKESVDFNGNTGPFIQYTHARICKLLRDHNIQEFDALVIDLTEKEKELIKSLALFPEIIQSASKAHSPAIIVNYCYEVVKAFNSYYQSTSIAKNVESETLKSFRLALSKWIATTIKNAMSVLGIQVPQRM